MILTNRTQTVFYSTVIDKNTVAHGFSTKTFGDGRDISILENYLQTRHIYYSHIVVPQQTHGTSVEYIGNDADGPRLISSLHCDGLITQQKNIVLTVVTADCVPIIFFDPVSQTIGISHQGWKGTTNRMPHHMVAAMIARGVRPADIRCVMGPAINTCCYHLNLYEMNRETLIREGVSKEKIDIFPFCTACDERRFYSYRRDGGIRGEMIHFVMLS